MSDTAYSSKQIAEMRSILETEKSRLELLLSHGKVDTQPVNRVSRIDAIQQQQMAIASQQQAAALLKRVELALNRIDSDAFGFCEDCDEPIAFQRLQAQPYASLCLDCQSEREGTG